MENNMLQSPKYYRELALQDETIEETLNEIFTRLVLMEHFQFVFTDNRLEIPIKVLNIIQKEKIEYLEARIKKMMNILHSKGFVINKCEDGEWAVPKIPQYSMYQPLTIQKYYIEL